MKPTRGASSAGVESEQNRNSSNDSQAMARQTARHSSLLEGLPGLHAAATNAAAAALRAGFDVDAVREAAAAAVDFEDDEDEAAADVKLMEHCFQQCFAELRE